MTELAFQPKSEVHELSIRPYGTEVYEMVSGIRGGGCVQTAHAGHWWAVMGVIPGHL